MEKNLLSKIDSITNELSIFETENAHILNKHIALKRSLELAKEEHKNFILSQNRHLIGLLCKTPNGRSGEISDVRISGKGGNLIIAVKQYSRYYRYETKEFTIDQLVIKYLPNIIRSIYRTYKR